eukprot:scaffold26918_cov63-Phaeocystis_antarctica.AAC.6
MPGFGSIFPTNRPRCTVLHPPPSKLSEFTHFTASEGYSLREDRGRGRKLDVRSKSGIVPSSSG